MTREELEEFRSLLQAWSDAGSANDGSGDIDATYDALCCFMTENAAELLSLAEEARWRKVEEEPPQTNTWVCAVNNTVVVSGFVCCAGPGAWISYHGGHSIPAPTHWRPLAKRPEER